MEHNYKGSLEEDDLSRDYTAVNNGGISPLTFRDRRAIVGLYRKTMEDYRASNADGTQLDPFESIKNGVIRGDPQYLQMIGDIARVFASSRIDDLKRTTSEVTGKPLSVKEVFLEGVRFGAVIGRVVDQKQLKK